MPGGVGVPAACALHRISASPPRRRLDSSPRYIHVAAAASPRLIFTAYPRHSRGVASTHLHGISTSQPRRRRDITPRNVHVTAAVAPRSVFGRFAPRKYRLAIAGKAPSTGGAVTQKSICRCAVELQFVEFSRTATSPSPGAFQRNPYLRGRRVIPRRSLPREAGRGGAAATTWIFRGGGDG